MGAKPLRKRKYEENLEILSEGVPPEPAPRREGETDLPLRWISKPMEALVDLEDKEALYAVLDRE